MASRSYVAIAGALMLVSVPSRAETIQVVIDKLVFSPAEISVKVGDTIEWVNKDRLAHTATVKGGWEVMIPAGKSGSGNGRLLLPLPPEYEGARDLRAVTAAHHSSSFMGAAAPPRLMLRRIMPKLAPPMPKATAK